MADSNNSTIQSDDMLVEQHQQEQNVIEEGEMAVEKGSENTNSNIVSDYDALKRRFEEMQAEYDEMKEKKRKEEHKKADEVSKNLIAMAGGLNEANRAKAEALAGKMREISESNPDVIDFFMELRSAPTTNPTKSITNSPQQVVDNFTDMQKKTTTPPVVHKSSVAASKTSTMPAQRPSQGLHKPVADYHSGKTENIPVHKANMNKRSNILGDLFPMESNKRIRQQPEEKDEEVDDFFGTRNFSIAAGKNTATGNPDDLVLMTPMLTEFWSNMIIQPLADKSADNTNVFFRKGQHSRFDATGNQAPVITVSASRCAKGEIPDHAGGRGILPYTAKCDLVIPATHETMLARRETLNNIFPDQVAEMGRTKTIGGALNWGASMHVFDHADKPMHHVMNSELSSEFTVLNRGQNFTIAASRQAPQLKLEGTEMQQQIAKAKACPYFEKYTEAEMVTLACLNRTNYAGFWETKTIPTY